MTENLKKTLLDLDKSPEAQNRRRMIVRGRGKDMMPIPAFSGKMA